MKKKNPFTLIHLKIFCQALKSAAKGPNLLKVKIHVWSMVKVYSVWIPKLKVKSCKDSKICLAYRQDKFYMPAVETTNSSFPSISPMYFEFQLSLGRPFFIFHFSIFNFSYTFESMLFHQFLVTLLTP